MRINLIFLDIFNHVLRHDNEALGKIKDRIDHDIEQDFFSYLSGMGDEILERLNYIMNEYNSGEESRVDYISKDCDKDTVEALLNRLNKSGIDKFLNRIDKKSINKLILSFFTKYFTYMENLKSEVKKLNS